MLTRAKSDRLEEKGLVYSRFFPALFLNTFVQKSCGGRWSKWDRMHCGHLTARFKKWRKSFCRLASFSD